MAYVYGLRSTDSDVFFYIGSTKNTLEHRLSQHLDMIRLGCTKNLHLVRKVNKIGAANIVIEPLEECDELLRFEREYETIQRALADGIKLTNIIHNRRNFEYARATEEYDEYELIPRHVEATVAALEGRTTKNGNALHDRLADLIDNLAWYLIRKFPTEYLQWIAECMAKHYDPEEAERQTAGFHQRISQVLECDGSGEASGVLG